MKSLRQTRVLIIGLGQIGGSLGLDLVADNIVGEVVGYDPDLSVLDEAGRRRVIDTAAATLEAGIEHADIVILAAPLRQIIEVLPVVAEHLNVGALVLDVGSTKRRLRDEAARRGLTARYVGGHPLTGTEGFGLAAAQRHMFVGTEFVLSPTGATAEECLGLSAALVSALGAKPLVLDAAEHDRLIALTSNLPYLLSLALVRLTTERAAQHPEIKQLIAGSFKSATRVAASSPDLPLDMFLTNTDNCVIALNEIIGHLESLKTLISSLDESRLRELIATVRDQHRDLIDG